MISQRKKSRGVLADGSANPVDVYVGNRIRMRRLMLRISQEKLAQTLGITFQQLGITFQQVQKYEQGYNRVSASRLWDFAKILRVPVTFFFDDMDEQTASQSPCQLYSSSAPLSFDKGDPLYDQQNIAMLKSIAKIKNPNLKQALYTLVDTLTE